MAKGSGRTKVHPTDESIELELAASLVDWNYFGTPTHNRIIRTMDLMVLNRRRMFDLMTGELAQRQLAIEQGTLYGLKLIGNISRSVKEQALTDEAIRGLFVNDDTPPKRRRIDHDYEETIDDD